LTDGKGITVDFSNTIIIFTSNIGTDTVSDSNDFEDVKGKFRQAVEQHFRHVLRRPEILGRIGDNIVPFKFMTHELLFDIAKARFSKIKEFVKREHGVEIHCTEDTLWSIVTTVDTSLGARNLNNIIESEISNKTARFIASNPSTTRITIVREENITVIEEA
jgi:ATP-dependent Clp protease ATP-binding subunit ClpA